METLKLDNAGGYDRNVHSNPEKFGLTVVLDNDIAGSYEFAILLVVKDTEGRLWYAMDSGCSCPSPFADVSELDRVWSLDTLREACGEDYSEYVTPAEERELTAALEALKSSNTSPLTRLEQIKKEMGL